MKASGLVRPNAAKAPAAPTTTSRREMWNMRIGPPGAFERRVVAASGSSPCRPRMNLPRKDSKLATAAQHHGDLRRAAAFVLCGRFSLGNSHCRGGDRDGLPSGVGPAQDVAASHTRASTPMAEAAASTLFDKIWDAHRVAQRADGRELIYIDRHVLHELHAPHAFEQLKDQQRPVRRP